MIQSKVDSRFLGSVKNSFFAFPDIPKPVQLFFWCIAVSVAAALIVFWWQKFGLSSRIKGFSSLFKSSGKAKKLVSAVGAAGAKSKSRSLKVSSDQDVLNWLVMTKAPFDISAERAGQRTLAAIVNVTGVDGRDIFVTFKDVVTESLLVSGTQVKCIFAVLQKDGKKVNAFVGKVKSLSENGGATITRTSAFGYIRRRAFSRRKVADQRFIKVKVWQLESEDFDVEFILDNIEPDIIIDNRLTVDANVKVPQILDISKGGLALLGNVREGGNMISRNDKLLLCMLIYQPKRKIFDPHLIYCESRAANAAGEGLVRLSLQFLRSLKVPPRKRSTLFKGQAVMAMNLAKPGKG